MIVKQVENFTHGLVTRIEKKSIPVGSAASMLNFRTKGDKTEIRRGYAVIGTELGAGGKSHGVHTGYKANGTPILFRKRGRKLEYATDVEGTWTEIGTDLFPAEAEDDDASFANYQSLAGAMTFVSSPNSSIYKIMTANPGSYTDLLSTTHRGRIGIYKNRMHLWDRRGTNFQQDRTAVYLSWIDNEKYTSVAAEAIGTGDGVTLVFNDTLVFKAGGAKRTCFGIVVKENGTVKFTDDFNGGLTHVNGASVATGTINYTTGAITLTYTAGNAPAGAVAITADYQWEDTTDEGIADFDYSATRVAGEGDVLRQDEGGAIISVEVYNDVYYCFHERAIYRIILSADDTDADNNIYRRNIGIQSHRGTVPTGDGIYFIDTASESDPQIRLLTIDTDTAEVLPISISRQLDLSGYDFSEAWGERQGNTVMWGCKITGASANNRMLVYDELFRTWDLEDYFSSDGCIFDGMLVLGDSISENAYLAFSGFDDDDSVIPATWESHQWDLDFPDRLKKVKKLLLEGEIAPTQVVAVDVALDDSAYTTIGYIRGDGDYIDTGQSVSIGPVTIGEDELGGGGDGTSAYHYFVELSMGQDKFQKIQIRFRTTNHPTTGDEGIGYFSFSLIRFQDIRLKQSKIPRKYRE